MPVICASLWPLVGISAGSETSDLAARMESDMDKASSLIAAASAAAAANNLVE